jgi:WD40 repeat protein
VSDFLNYNETILRDTQNPRDAISCMDWRKDILVTGSWDSTVKVWHCSEANGFKVRLSSDLIAEMEHNSQVTCLSLCPKVTQLVTG